MSLEETCWTLINAAAAGDAGGRSLFAERYMPVVRAYLGARWRSSRLAREIDDAVQEVFLDFFKERGALGRVEAGRSGGFRGFLYGVVRNVARRVETRFARSKERSGQAAPIEVPGEEPDLAHVFDRAWSMSLLDQALQRHRERAADQGDVGARRVELLRLRFWEDLPIRAIAQRLGREPHKVHKDYARAREDFRRALREVVAYHHPDAPESVDMECERLLTHLP